MLAGARAAILVERVGHRQLAGGKIGAWSISAVSAAAAGVRLRIGAGYAEAQARRKTIVRLKPPR